MLQILEGPILAQRTTLRLGGQALAEVRIPDREALEGLPAALQRLGGTPTMLGCGSNILARDGELPVVVVSLAMDDGPRGRTAPPIKKGARSCAP